MHKRFLNIIFAPEMTYYVSLLNGIVVSYWAMDLACIPSRY